LNKSVTNRENIIKTKEKKLKKIHCQEEEDHTSSESRLEFWKIGYAQLTQYLQNIEQEKRRPRIQFRVFDPFIVKY